MGRIDQISSPWRQESSFPHDNVVEWDTIEDFHDAANHEDGFHVIANAHGGPLEFFMAGEPFQQSTGPVMSVFSGAVQMRGERTPPFASGRNLAPGLNVPLIAISDPSLSLDKILGIGWYAGSAFQDVQSAVEELLRPLAVALAGQLWLVGGSAGGFAALETAHRLGRYCSAFVWNPQTDIAEYSARYVKQYAEVAFPGLGAVLGAADWKRRFHDEARSWGRHVDVIHDAVPAQAPQRLLYLQGADDWHMQLHCAPYVKEHDYRRHAPGLWTRGDNRVIWLAETGKGHTPPAAETIHTILSRLFSAESGSVLERTMELDERPLFVNRAPDQRPEDLLARKAQIAGLISWRRSGSIIECDASSLAPGLGRMRWSAVALDAKDHPISRSDQVSLSETWTVPEMADVSRLRITLVDGFGNVLVRRYLKTDR